MNSFDPDHQKRIEALIEENNKLLHKVHRSLLFGRVFRIIYWLIIIGIAVGAFYFLQPYLDSARQLYDNVLNAQGQLGDFSNLFFGQDLPPLSEDVSTDGVGE